MTEPKTITCPHCAGSGVDPHDDGGTTRAKPACLMCLGAKVVANPAFVEQPETPAPAQSEGSAPSGEAVTSPAAQTGPA